MAGYADWLGLDDQALATRAGATAKAVAIGIAGIAAIFAWAIFVALLVGIFLPGGLGTTARTVLSTLASGAGTLSVVALYLRYSDRDVSFLDLHVPDLRGFGYAIVGTLAILGGNLAIGLAFQQVGIKTAQHTIVRTAETDPIILLALVPLSYLVIAPGEELLFRNVVQKSLRETFSPVAGVVIASAIFAAVHLPAYSSPGQSLVATLDTLVIIFVLALVLGTVYERTGNVVVSMLVHGTFNAIAFALTYAQFVGRLG